MAIRAGAGKNIRKFLAEIDDEVRYLEGEDCPEEEKAWVECRPLSYGEMGKLEAVKGSFETRYKDGDAIITRNVDWHSVTSELVWYSLVDAGNILDQNGKERFRSRGSTADAKKRFLKVWEETEPPVARAIIRTAWEANLDLEIDGTKFRDPMIWLRVNYPDIYEEVREYLESGSAKN